MSASVKLFRPVGQKELDLIRATGFKSFPPRLSGQPYFYPVTNKEYAIQIARDWNTKDLNSGFRGYVLEFEINNEFFEHHNLTLKIVGNKTHQEYWVPAELLPEFNRHLIGSILISEEFV